MKKKIETVRDEIVVDSRDVDRAIEQSLKREEENKAADGTERARVVTEGILVDRPGDNK